MEKYWSQDGERVYVLSTSRQSYDINFDKNIISVRDKTNEYNNKLTALLYKGTKKIISLLGFCATTSSDWCNNSISYGEKIVRYCQPNVILASYPTIEALEIGCALSSRFNIPLITDFRDGLVFENDQEKKYIYTKIFSYYKKLEMRLVNCSAVVFTVTDPITEYFKNKYCVDNVYTVPNGFDSDLHNDVEIVNLDSEAVNIVHTGRLASGDKGRDIKPFISALRLAAENIPAKDWKLVFHFVGNLTREEAAMLKQFVDQGMVRRYGHKDRKFALGMQKESDLLMLITQTGKSSIATGKIFEYLSAQKTIWGLTKDTEAEKIINSCNAGFVTAPNQIRSIYESLCFLNKYGKSLRCESDKAEVFKFLKEKQMKRMLSIIKSINE